MMLRYRGLPEWIRWIFLVPLSAGFAFAISGLIALIREKDFAVVGATAGLVSFISALYHLAPRAQPTVVRLAIGTRMFYATTWMILVWTSNEALSRQTLLEFAGEILAWAVAICLYRTIFRLPSDLSLRLGMTGEYS